MLSLINKIVPLQAYDENEIQELHDDITKIKSLHKIRLNRSADIISKLKTEIEELRESASENEKTISELVSEVNSRSSLISELTNENEVLCDDITKIKSLYKLKLNEKHNYITNQNKYIDRIQDEKYELKRLKNELVSQMNNIFKTMNDKNNSLTELQIENERLNKLIVVPKEHEIMKNIDQISKDIESKVELLKQSKEIPIEHVEELLQYATIDYGTLSYRGEMKNNLYHGKGVLTNKISHNNGGGFVLNNLNSYEGEFKLGKFNGKGVYDEYYTMEDAPHRDCYFFMKSSYSGDWIDNKKNGKGQYVKYNYTPDPSDRSYNNNQRQLRLINYEYNGEFKDDNMNGKGKFIVYTKEFSSKPNFEYIGNFKNGLADGYGEFYYYNSNNFIKTLLYRGNFKEGKYHGKGEEYIYSLDYLSTTLGTNYGNDPRVNLSYKDFPVLYDYSKEINREYKFRYWYNIIYKGEWIEGKKNGFGHLESKHYGYDFIFTGEFKNNIPDGYGILTEIKVIDNKETIKSRTVEKTEGKFKYQNSKIEKIN